MIGARWIQIAAVAISAIQPSPAISESNEVPEDRIVFCYFKSVKINPSSFSLLCTTSTANGNEAISEGHTNAPANIGIPYHEDFVNRLWYFSVPKESDSASFSIVYEEDGQAWSSTPFFKISSSLFIYDTNNYSALNEGAGWGMLDMPLADFTVFVLSWIDPNSNSPINGYNAYPQIQNAIRFSASDDTDPRAINWYDPFIGKTSFQDKWDLIRTNYESHAPSKFADVPYYVLGAALLLLSLCLVAVPLWDANKRRAVHESN